MATGLRIVRGKAGRAIRKRLQYFGQEVMGALGQGGGSRSGKEWQILAAF